MMTEWTKQIIEMLLRIMELELLLNERYKILS